MKLEVIINAIRNNNLKDLLPSQLIDLEWSEIIIYGEISVSYTTNYKFFRAEKGLKNNIQYNNLNYELLCSLLDLSKFCRYFNLKFKNVTDEVIGIEILDYLDKLALRH